MGANHWRAAEEWPAATNHLLYLHSEGRANSRKGNGSLSVEPPTSGGACDVFVCDPEVPVPAPGAFGASGQFDQSAVELGNNLLVYTSQPLPHPMLVFGSPRVRLHCATSARHSDFTAKLIRVTPNGAAEFLCIGISRSSYLFRRQSYEADRIYEWNFALEPTCCLFSAGDRIRLEIASSAFPLYDSNPGTDVPSCEATSWDWQRSTQVVFHTPDHASVLELPVSEAAE
jgi:putative CocE/NonD family hydrolase